MADGSVIFSTELDPSGLRNGLSSIGNTAGKWAAGAGKTMVAGLGAVSAGLVVLGKKAFDYYTTMETYQTNFGVMLGDEAAAVQHVADLRQMAADTPFGMDDLANASQTLQSFGMNADDTMIALQRLGDISLGNKDRMQGLTLALAQVSSAGKLTGNDLLQMVNAGFNPLQTIAERTGVSIGDLKDVMGGGKGSKSFQKAVKAAKREVKLLGDEASEGAKWLAQIGEEGMISADMVGKAMEAETSEGGRFYNGMKKASETITGMLSTLEDDFSALVGDVFTPLIEGFGANVIPLAQSYLQGLTDAFTKGGTDGLVAKLGEVISDAATNLALAIPSMASVASGILSSIGTSLLENKDDITTGLSNAITAITESGLPQTFTTTLLTLGGSVVSSIAKGISENGEGIITGIVEGVTTYLSEDNVASLATDLVGAATSIVKGIATNLPTVISTLGSGLLTTLGTFFSENSLTEMGTAAKSLVDGLLKGVIGTVGDSEDESLLNQFGRSLLDGLNTFFETNFPELQIKLPKWDDLVKDIKAGWDLIKDEVANYLKTVIGIDLDFWMNGGKAQNPDAAPVVDNETVRVATERAQMFSPQYVDPMAGQSAYLLANWITGGQLSSQTTDAAKEAGKSIATTVSESAATSAKERSGEFWSAVVEKPKGVTDGTEKTAGAQFAEDFAFDVKTSLSEKSGDITQSIGDVLDSSASTVDVAQFANVGAQIMAGIGAGIDASVGDVTGKITSAVAALLAAAQSAAGIHSPSTLFCDEFGIWLLPGAAQGVDKTAFVLAASVQRAVDNAVNGVHMDGRSIASRILSGGSYGSSQALRDAMSAATINQTNNFNVPVQTPDEFANTMFLYSTYGLDARG